MAFSTLQGTHGRIINALSRTLNEMCFVFTVCDDRKSNKTNERMVTSETKIIWRLGEWPSLYEPKSREKKLTRIACLDSIDGYSSRQ